MNTLEIERSPPMSAARRAPSRSDPLIYTDEQLERVPGGPRRLIGGSSLVGHLLEAPTAHERQRLLRGMLNAIGFQWLGYGKVDLQRGMPVPQSFYASLAHPEWTELYFRERFYQLDFRHYDAPPSSLPLAWDLEDITARASAPAMTSRHRRFAQAMREMGIGSGVFMSFASTQSAQERTVISLTSAAPQRHWIVDSVLGQAVMLGLCVHELLSLHLRVAEDAPSMAPLSAVQQEILRCLALGQSDKEIAYRLQLSAHTVDYHMRQLRKRFGVRNRVQLVHAAVGHGGD